MRPKLKLVTDAKRPRFVRVADALYLNTESGIYFVRKTFKRYKIPPIFETTKEESITKAKARAAVMISDHLTKYLGDGGNGILSRRVGKPVREIIAEILANEAEAKRIGTQKMYKGYLSELSNEWGAWDISKITLPAWQGWLQGFRKRKSRQTFADYQKFMNILLGYAYRQRYCSHLLKVPNPDKVKQVGKVYTRKEIQALWKEMNEETRDQFVLSYECFMRLREALHLTWERIDLRTGVLTLRAEDVKTGSKTGKGRSFIISKHALRRLRARRKRIKVSPYVFPSPLDLMQPVQQNKTAWDFAKENAGITGRARWHDLRHTALSRALLEEGADITKVSEYAGVSIRTLQRVYLHATHKDTASVAKAIRILK